MTLGSWVSVHSGSGNLRQKTRQKGKFVHTMMKLIVIRSYEDKYTTLSEPEGQNKSWSKRDAYKGEYYTRKIQNNLMMHFKF